MKKTSKVFSRMMTVLLVISMLISLSPVYALGGGVQVDTTPYQQFCGADVKLGDATYLCALDLGAPVVDSGSDSVLTAGTTVRFELFFNINNAWYAARKQELQGDPGSLFTVRFDKTAGGDRVTDPVWKTYPDDGYGERYYLEFTVTGGESAAPVDLTVALTQPAYNNVGAAYRITGTSAAWEGCVADFTLPGYTGPCTVQFGEPVTSTGDANNMTAGSTVCFPLMFLGGDGQLYAAYNTELQGNPASLFTVEESFTAGGKLFKSNGWKTWDNGHWFLEYSVAATETAQDIAMSLRLRQKDIYRASPWQGFAGKAPAAASAPLCSLPINLGGTVYDCIADLGAVEYSSGTGTVPPGGTVRIPLVFLGGDGVWYFVREGELQGTPDSLLETAVTVTQGQDQLTTPKWVTVKADDGAPRYYLEATVIGTTGSSFSFSAKLRQTNKNLWGNTVTASGTVGQKQPCVAPISIGGVVYDCTVDLRGYILGAESADKMVEGSTVCMPLMFLGGDGAWYPVLKDELQGTPDQLFTILETMTSGGSLLTCTGWKMWDNGHYYLEYTVADSELETPLDFSVTLKQDSLFRLGTANRFQGTAPASTNPIWQTCKVPISIGGTVYDCVVDLRGYLTSTGSETLTGGGSVCFPLMFLGGDGQWYPVLEGELQGRPGDLLSHKLEAFSGSTLLTCLGWKTWENGHYYLEYAVADAEHETKVDFQLTLTKTGGKHGEADRFTGKVPASTDPFWDTCHVSINIGGIVYTCGVDLQGYLLGAESADKMVAGSTVCFPLMFLGGDGNWYPVLENELQGDPNVLFAVKENMVSGGALLTCSGFKTWGNGHWFLEYVVADTREEVKLDFTVTLQQADGKREGTAAAFTGTAPASTNPKWTECVLPIEIDGTVYECIVDLRGCLPSSGSTTLLGGGTLAFPLMFMGGDGNWYPVLKQEVQEDPAKVLKVAANRIAGGELLTYQGFKTWSNGHYYAEFAVAAPAEDTKLEVAAWLNQNGKLGTPMSFSGTVTAGAGQAVADGCTVPIQIDGTVYDCIVELQGALTSSGSTTLSGGGTVALPLMFLGGDGVWYPVLKDELQGDPAQLLSVSEQILAGEEILSCTGWKTWDNGHWFLEYKVASPAEETAIEFSAAVSSNGKQGAAAAFAGIVTPGPSISDQQIPLKNSASLVVERIEECQEFNTLSFTIAGVRYDEQWPVDFESPNTSSAVIADGTIIRADLCFKVNGMWYPVRQQECNESVEELFTYAYEVLEGEDFLGVPRFTTRYDQYGDIWQFEVAVSSEEEGDFCFTLQLVAKDGSKLGSKYKVSGRVQNGEMVTTVEEVPEESGNGLWIGLGVGAAVLAAALAAVLLLLKKKKKGA